MEAKNETVSFRIDSKLLKLIRDEANQNDTSLNTYVNATLKQKVTWGTSAIKSGFIQFPRSLLKKVFDRVSTDDLKNIATEFQHSKEAEDILAFFKNPNTVDKLSSLILNWAKANNFEYKIIHNDDKFLSFVISHNTGIKFAFCVAECWKTLLEDFSIKGDYKISDTVIQVDMYKVLPSNTNKLNYYEAMQLR
jgi:hypothetical protein